MDKGRSGRPGQTHMAPAVTQPDADLFISLAWTSIGECT